MQASLAASMEIANLAGSPLYANVLAPALSADIAPQAPRKTSSKGSARANQYGMFLYLFFIGDIIHVSCHKQFPVAPSKWMVNVPTAENANCAWNANSYWISKALKFLNNLAFTNPEQRQSESE